MSSSDVLTTVVNDTPHHNSTDVPHNQSDVTTPPQPFRWPRFIGTAPMQVQVLAAFRYARVMNAINSFPDGMNIQLRIMNRDRWTVGLHRELVCLSCMILGTCLHPIARFA